MGILIKRYIPIYSKILEKNKLIDNIYVSSYNYSKLPIYLFPCVNDIHYVNEYSLTEAKITNRLSVIIKQDSYGEYLFLEYKHSPNVDVDKVESSINNVLKQLI